MQHYGEESTMIAVKESVLLDSWVAMSWHQYLSYIEQPQLEKAKAYYYKEHGRFEMLPVGFGHGKSHVVVTYAINLFCALKAMPLCLVDTTTLRKAGHDDSQPDLSIWTGVKARAIPDETGIVDLDKYPTPDLVVEIANTSLLDDLGTKRSLYEELGILEYWVVDIKKSVIIAFEMLEQGSQRIDTSQVLPRLKIAVLERALKISRDTDQAQMGAWLLQQFQQ